MKMHSFLMHAVFTKYINILEPGMMFYHEYILPVLEKLVNCSVFPSHRKELHTSMLWLFNESCATTGFLCTIPENSRNGWSTWSGRTGPRLASQCCASIILRNSTSTEQANVWNFEKMRFPPYSQPPMTHRKGKERFVCNYSASVNHLKIKHHLLHLVWKVVSDQDRNLLNN